MKVSCLPVSLFDEINSGRMSFVQWIDAAPLCDGQEWFDRLHAVEPGLLKVVLVP